MKKTMIAIAFAVASVPMMFAAQAPAQTPANPPAAAQAPKPKKHVKKATKKTTPKKDAGSSTTAAPAPVSK